MSGSPTIYGGIIAMEVSTDGTVVVKVSVSLFRLSDDEVYAVCTLTIVKDGVHMVSIPLNYNLRDVNPLTFTAFVEDYDYTRSTYETRLSLDDFCFSDIDYNKLLDAYCKNTEVRALLGASSRMEWVIFKANYDGWDFDIDNYGPILRPLIENVVVYRTIKKTIDIVCEKLLEMSANAQKIRDDVIAMQFHD